MSGDRRLKALGVSILSILVAACGSSSPAPTVETGPSYRIISETSDPSNGGLFLWIQISGPITQLTIKKAAESAISERSGSYSRIIVTSIGEKTGMKPLATSTLKDGSISHRFHTQAETERIQTH